VNTNGHDRRTSIRLWFSRLNWIKKLLASIAAFIIALGGIAAAIPAILGLYSQFIIGQGSAGGNVTGPNGVKVIAVVPDSPADHAGIKANDKLAYIGGKYIDTVGDFKAALEKQHRHGDVLIAIERNSDTKFVHATLQRVNGSNLALGVQVKELRARWTAGSEEPPSLEPGNYLEVGSHRDGDNVPPPSWHPRNSVWALYTFHANGLVEVRHVAFKTDVPFDSAVSMREFPNCSQIAKGRYHDAPEDAWEITWASGKTSFVVVKRDPNLHGSSASGYSADRYLLGISPPSSPSKLVDLENIWQDRPFFVSVKGSCSA
jgi:PDZ domain